MDKDLLTHPLLKHQQKEAALVLWYANNILDVLSGKRKDLITPILVDVIIKLFRRDVCSEKQCSDCVKCSPHFYMKDEAFKEFISLKKSQIIQEISDWFNNSFNVPQRWINIQKVIDRLFERTDNLIVFEVGCWWGQIGKFLTNSNLSKSFFSSDFSSEETDSRFVQYYWVDPNLIIWQKNLLMMINGESVEMQFCREVFQKFNNLISDETRMLLQKKMFDDTTLFDIFEQLKSLSLNIRSWVSSVIFLTSIMKYHFNNKQKHQLFMDTLSQLAMKLQSLNNIDKIFYISNEVYGKDGWLYPFENSDYSKLQVISSQFKNWKFIEGIDYPEYTWTF